MIGALHVNLAVNDAAQSDAQSRQFRSEQLGVADDRGIGLERVRMLLDVRFDVLAAHLFFAFNQKPDVHRQAAIALHQRFHGFNEDPNLPLVIGGAASINVVSADLGLERRRLPFVDRIGRLDIVMPVQKERGLAGRAQPFGVDQRVALPLNQFGAGNPGIPKTVAHELGGAPHISKMFRIGANTRNPQERL